MSGFGAWVGRYRLVVTPELLEFIEERFVRSAPCEQRDQARSEALAEARAAELEIHADGTVESRAGEQRFFRVLLDWPSAPRGVGHFEKPGGVRVALRVDELGRLVATQAGKPDSVFARTQSNCCRCNQVPSACVAWSWRSTCVLDGSGTISTVNPSDVSSRCRGPSDGEQTTQ